MLTAFYHIFPGFSTEFLNVQVDTAIYFKNVYEDSWFFDDFAEMVIKKVDSSDVIDVQAIKSPVRGVLTPPGCPAV